MRRAGARWALAGLFGAQFVLLDVALRGPGAYAGHPREALSAAGAIGVWLALAALARSWRARGALALGAGILLVGTGAFLVRYRVPFDGQALQAAVRYWRDVRPLLVPRLPWVALAVVLGVGVELGLLAGGAWGAAPRRRAPALGGLVVALAVVLVAGPSTPEARLLASPLAYRRASGDVVGPLQLPEVRVVQEPPSVVLIVSESLRADSYCSAPVADCPFSPAVNALLPGRLELSRMRSVASFTVISMAALTTGRAQAVPRDELLGYPTVFELAHTLRGPAGERLTTAYWAAHCRPMFERESVEQAIDRRVALQDLTGGEDWCEDLDDRLLEHVRRELPALPRPFFLVVQLASTHAPYAVDPDDAPFQPWSHDIRWDTLPQLFNAYRNSIHRQDARLARALAPLVASPEFGRTVVMFTSDHGEEFGEHRQIHHGQDVRDTQLRVPFWLAAGEGALTGAQRAALRANRDATTTHLDLLPTLLDLWGLLDSFALSTPVRALPGRSLLRPLGPLPAPLPLANCTEAFPCPFRNAGVLGEGHKIEAQAWDPGWSCWRTGGDPEQPAPVDSPPCRALVEASRRWFPVLPGGQPNAAPR